MCIIFSFIIFISLSLRCDYMIIYIIKFTTSFLTDTKHFLLFLIIYFLTSFCENSSVIIVFNYMFQLFTSYLTWSKLRASQNYIILHILYSKYRTVIASILYSSLYYIIHSSITAIVLAVNIVDLLCNMRPSVQFF